MARIDNYTKYSEKGTWDASNGVYYSAVKVSGTSKDVYCTINGGEFWGGYCAVEAGEGGKKASVANAYATINGGTFFAQHMFLTDGETYTNDINTLLGNVTVNGGSFIDFDPSEFIKDDIYEVVTDGTYTYKHTFIAPSTLKDMVSSDTYILNLQAAILAGGNKYSAPNAYGGYDTWSAEIFKETLRITETITVPVYKVVKKGDVPPTPPTPPTPSGDGTPSNPYVVDDIETADLTEGNYYYSDKTLYFATSVDYVRVYEGTSSQSPEEFNEGALVYFTDKDEMKIITLKEKEQEYLKEYGEFSYMIGGPGITAENPVIVSSVGEGPAAGNILIAGYYYYETKKETTYVATSRSTFKLFKDDGKGPGEPTVEE